MIVAVVVLAASCTLGSEDQRASGGGEAGTSGGDEQRAPGGGEPRSFVGSETYEDGDGLVMHFEWTEGDGNSVEGELSQASLYGREFIEERIGFTGTRDGGRLTLDIGDAGSGVATVEGDALRLEAQEEEWGFVAAPEEEFQEQAAALRSESEARQAERRDPQVVAEGVVIAIFERDYLYLSQTASPGLQAAIGDEEWEWEDTLFGRWDPNDDSYDLMDLPEGDVGDPELAEISPLGPAQAAYAATVEAPDGTLMGLEVGLVPDEDGLYGFCGVTLASAPGIGANEFDWLIYDEASEC